MKRDVGAIMIRSMKSKFAGWLATSIAIAFALGLFAAGRVGRPIGPAPGHEADDLAVLILAGSLVSLTISAIATGLAAREAAPRPEREGDARRERHQLHDFLDFSKDEADAPAPESVDFDLRGLMREVADLLGPWALGKGLRIDCQFPQNLPDRYEGDPARVRRVLIILVGNAVKFARSGAVTLEARAVALADASATVRVSVVDDGLGLAASRPDAIDASSSRADGEIDRRHEPGGLVGLATCRRLVERMGGSIVMDGQIGRGGTFWIELTWPMRPPIARTGRPGGLAGLRVLLVDRDVEARGRFRDDLLSWACRVHEASSPGQGLRCLRSAPAGDPFRLALIGARMTSGRGRRLRRVLDEDARLAALKVVLIRSPGHRLDPKGDGRPHAVSLARDASRPQLFEAIAEAFDRPSPE